MSKKAKKPAPRKVAKPVAKKVVAKKAKAAASKSKGVAKGKKAVVKKKATPTKSKAKVVTKKKAKSKAPVKKKAVAIKPKAKVVKPKAKPAKPQAKAVKRPVVTQNNISPKPESVVPPVTTPVLTHGVDQHFIPVQDKNAPVTAPDGHQAEIQFHHNEEVAIHQENEKVKANMASRMGRKRIFRVLGK